MDEYSERRYQGLKMTWNNPETFRQQKWKAGEKKGRAVVLASWLRATEKSMNSKRIEEKLA